VHEYDTVLKSLLTGSRNSFFHQITGAKRGRWLNVELPKVVQPRVDLLFETAGNRELILLELQSRNDATMAVRMAEYALLVWRVYKRFPRMYVLYIGSQRLRMPSELDTPSITCRYTVIDIRQWNAETLLQSNHPADAVLAILGRNADRLETVRRILQRIAKMNGASRKIAFSKLMILAGIRRLAGVVEQEARQMPIHYDIMDHEVIGPAIRKGLVQGIAQGKAQGIAQGIAEGKAEGIAEGIAEGKLEEAASLAQRQLTARFGPLSPKTMKRLAKLTLPELEDLAIRLLTAKSITELFPR
jgi:predicted transposase YdaD